MQDVLQKCNSGGAGDSRTIMAFVRKIKGLLKLGNAHDTDKVRAVLLESYARHNTLNGVAKEFGMKPGAMSTWFRSVGLHSRAQETSTKDQTNPPARKGQKKQRKQTTTK